MQNSMQWIQDTPAGAALNVRVIPRAPRNRVEGVLGDALKIRLQAPPVDGKANAALVRFLADTLDISAARVEILAGETGRRKRIRLAGMTAAAVRAGLGVPQTLS